MESCIVDASQFKWKHRTSVKVAWCLRLSVPITYLPRFVFKWRQRKSRAEGNHHVERVHYCCCWVNLVRRRFTKALLRMFRMHEMGKMLWFIKRKTQLLMSNKSTCSARPSSDVGNYCDIMQQIITTFPHLTLLEHTFCLSPCIPSCKYRHDRTFLRTPFTYPSACSSRYGHTVWVNRGVYTTFNGVFFPLYFLFTWWLAKNFHVCLTYTLHQSPTVTMTRRWKCTDGNSRTKLLDVKQLVPHNVHAVKAWTHRERAPFSNKRDGHIQRIVEIKMAKRQTVIALLYLIHPSVPPHSREA